MEFEADVKAGALYGKKIQVFALTEYDRALPGDATADIKVTVDHVIPQKLGAG